MYEYAKTNSRGHIAHTDEWQQYLMKSTNTWSGSAILQYSGPRTSVTTLINSLSNHSLSDVRVNLQTYRIPFIRLKPKKLINFHISY